MDIEVSIEVRSRACATWSAQDKAGRWRHMLDVLVEPDGEVLAWDEVAGHYTRLAQLSAEQVERARALAAGRR